jgi:hypothetical protein
MSDVANDVPAAAVAPQEDRLLQIIEGAHELRLKLATLRKTNPGEYDRVLRQNFAVDVLLLLERLARELGDRVNDVAYTAAMTASAVNSMLEEDDSGDGDDGGISVDDEEIAALRTVSEYVRGLPPEGVPEDVRKALQLLVDGGLFSTSEDDGDDEPEDESAGEGDEKEATNAETDGPRSGVDAPGGTGGDAP